MEQDKGLLAPEEIRDRWHIIWDMCWEFIDDPAVCNELSTDLDSFIEAQLDKDNQKIEELCKNCSREDWAWKNAYHSENIEADKTNMEGSR